MATRNPADTTLPNYASVDWYEPPVSTGWTAQSDGACPEFLNSAQVYGHDTWDAVNEVVVPVAPIMVEYPA